MSVSNTRVLTLPLEFNRVTRTAVVAGVGPGLGASLARRFAAEGLSVGLFARSTEFTESLAVQVGVSDPDAIAESYWHLVEQDRSPWTLELDRRPHVEKLLTDLFQGIVCSGALNPRQERSTKHATRMDCASVFGGQQFRGRSPAEPPLPISDDLPPYSHVAPISCRSPIRVPMSDGTDPLSDGIDDARTYTDELSSALTQSGENRMKQWFLLTGPRTLVAAVLLAVVFGSLLALALLRPLDVRNLLTETTAVQLLFSTLLSGAILLVSIVVSINSIVLSQEITDIENQQERITASMEYRRHIEDFIRADVTPARPAEFLTAVLHSVFRELGSLRQIAEDSSDGEFRDRAVEFVDRAVEEVEYTRDTLESAQYGSVAVLMAGLDFDYSGQIHAARTLKREFYNELDDDGQDAVDGLIDSLQHIATGRAYFKSLYYKRELAQLSSRLLYVSLPVIVFTSYVILALDAGLFPDVRFLGLSSLLLSLSFAYTVALAPYVVLTAYVVRASTITLRTLAAGPFVFQEGSTVRSFDWEGLDESRDWELSDYTDEQ